MTSAPSLDDQPAEQPGACGQLRADKCLGCDTVGRERRAGVEAEPSEPQDPGAQDGERQRVGRHHVAWPAAAASEHERECKCGGTAVDLDDVAAGEVEDPSLE